MKLLQTSGLIVACASLFACASPIKNMSPHEAIQFGNNQFYEMPSYRMDMSSKLISMGITGAASDKDAKQTEKFNKYMTFFGKNFVFNGTGVFDIANDQYQLIPEYGYEAKNVNARIRFPVVLDRKAKLLYADLSALDGIVTNIDNAGKYSRFDLSKLPIAEGTDKKLVDIMRKYSQQLLSKVPADTIIEQPLTADDRKLRAVRKLQFDLKPQEQLSTFPVMLDEMIAAIAPGGAKTENELKTETEKIKNEFADLISPESRDQYTFAFNRAGQIVSMRADSNYLITSDQKAAAPTSNTPNKKTGMTAIETPPSKAPPAGFQIHFVTDMTVSDIGKAKLIDPPTAQNSVDGMENIKGSLIGESFSKKYDDTLVDNTIEVAPVTPAKKAKRTHKKDH